jgi:hypothetical protein
MGRRQTGADTAGSDTDDAGDRSTDFPDRGGIDVFDSVFVRQPIRDGQTDAVRETLARWARDHAERDARTVLPVEGVTLVTLFLDTGGFGWQPAGDGGSGGTDTDRRDALLWYVEVPDDDAPAWTDPDATIRDRSPLFAAGLDELLADTATVHADGRGGHQLITHATNPHRRDRYADHCGPSLVAPVAGDDLPIPVAVLSLPLKPGVVSWLTGRVVAAGNWLKRFDRVADAIRDETDTLEAEAMYTESLLLEPVADRRVLHYYMEAEDVDRLYDAFEDSDNPEVRFSKWAIRRLFEDPGAVLEPPVESACEVLVHAVDPERP